MVCLTPIHRASQYSTERGLQLSWGTTSLATTTSARVGTMGQVKPIKTLRFRLSLRRSLIESARLHRRPSDCPKSSPLLQSGSHLTQRSISDRMRTKSLVSLRQAIENYFIGRRRAASRKSNHYAYSTFMCMNLFREAGKARRCSIWCCSTKELGLTRWLTTDQVRCS